MSQMNAPVAILDNLVDVIDGNEPTHASIQTREVLEWASTMPVSVELRTQIMLERLQDGIHKRNNSKGN